MFYSSSPFVKAQQASEYSAVCTLSKLMYPIVRKWHCEIFMSAEIQTGMGPHHLLSALVNFTDDKTHQNNGGCQN